MDTTDFGNETINLGHGSGGLMTRELLDQVIFKKLGNQYLDKKHDGAVIKVEGDLAISTDSFVISPVFFKGGNIGELAVNGTVNDVAMCGANAEFLSLAFIVEEGLEMSEFIKIVDSIRTTAERCGVKIVTGDTKVVERGKGDKIFINTTGFGRVHPKADISTRNIKSGDKIILSGEIAQHGMAIMSQREGLQFESTIISDTTNLNFLVTALLDEFGNSIHLLRDPTRGGVAAVLSEIATDTNLGIVIDENKIPVDDQVAAACEILGLDPLYVANEGLFIAIVDAEVERELTALMKGHEKGRKAVCIGEITQEHSNKVVMKSSIGGKRMVTPLIGEQLPRIC